MFPAIAGGLTYLLTNKAREEITRTYYRARDGLISTYNRISPRMNNTPNADNDDDPALDYNRRE